MYSVLFETEGTITDYAQLDAAVRAHFDLSLEELTGIETQEELDTANPWVRHEDGMTRIYVEEAR